MSHPAEKLNAEKPLVYTAMSWRYFAYRIFISKYVLENGYVPLNPFMIFEYFMADTVDRNLVREANNNLVRISDELWCFGEISDGVQVEIDLFNDKGGKIRFLKLKNLRNLLKYLNLK